MRIRHDRLNVMKLRPNPEFDKFTKVMDGLMAVPYRDLQEKLKEHKNQRAKRKRPKTKRNK